MRQHVHLEFSTLGGRTELVRRRFGWPFFVGRQLRSPDAPTASVVTLQSASGTLNAGDETATTVVVESDAHAVLRSQGAPSVHRSRAGGKAVEHTEVRVAEGGLAELVAEPRILFPGSHYEQTTDLHVQGAGRILFGEGIVALRGESGATFSRYEAALRIFRDDALLVDDASSTGGWGSMPGRIGDFLAFGHLVAVADGELPSIGRDWNDSQRYLASTVLPNGAGVMVRIAAVDGRHLRRSLDDAASVLRAALRA
ncbi:urease accessory protein UreD [Agromyces aerolatus]|uniref:urease accessory protein UreD n=1 Tax=Agromyces sp. LY-1074 TaxID=3074080 RepID=UPI00285F4BC8|nr:MULTISPECIES: urease accessory protein UreD [unclassified Agromyces]MDR5700888.1 urease accessory protein UreD [Agromyces sp. LY-1074]MDR5707451.1 urease accessory protein UreD [Agromyces sp. LY-1358]